MAKPVLTVDSISLTLKNEPILKRVSLMVSAGEVVGITGRNGSGKSMLFKCIAGLYLPQKGEITANGFAVVKEKRFPPEFGALIEKPGFLGGLTAYENLSILACIQNKIGKKEILEAIRIVGLEHAAHKKVKKFSLGMKQRLGIAQAIMEKPKLLILDEPTSGLDEAGVAQVRTLIGQLKSEGTAILIASHISEDIEALSDRIYEMELGELRELVT